MATRRGGRATTWWLAAALVGSLLSATPRATAAPLPQLTRDVRVDVSGMRSVDVFVPNAVKVPYPDWFDAPAKRFQNSVPGAGMALVSLDYAFYGPTLIAHSVHYRDGGRNVVMLFGWDASGKDILLSETLPRGRYRLYAWSPRPTRMVLHLPGLAGGTTALRPSRPFTGYVDRLDAPLAVTPTGMALGTTRTMGGSQFMVLTASAEHLNPSATGYQQGQCLYDGGPPGGVFLHFCPGGSGGSTGIGLPATDVDQLNAGAIVGIPGGTKGVGTWVLGAGAIRDQTTTLVWLPLPLPLPKSASTARLPSATAATAAGHDAPGPSVPTRNPRHGTNADLPS